MAVLLFSIAQSASASDELHDHGQLLLKRFFVNGSGSSRKSGWVAADGGGNYYLGGIFSRPRRFGTNIFVPGKRAEAFIAKYDRLTNCIWARHIPNATAYGGAVFQTEALFVTGETYGPVTLPDWQLPGNDRTQAYLARLDSNGNFRWAKRAVGKHAPRAWDVAVDESGNAYFTGEFLGELTFDNTTIRGRRESGSRELFVGKCDYDGNLIWLIHDANLRTSVRGIAVDRQRNVFVTGIFNGLVPFKAGALANEGEDVFLAKYDSDGKPLWARAPGGAPKRLGINVAVDGYGNPHIVGLIHGTEAFGPTNFVHTEKFNHNVFLARYNPAGDFQWVRQFRRGDFDFSNVVSLEAKGVSLPPRIAGHPTAETNSEAYKAVAANLLQRPPGAKTEAGVAQRPVLGVQKFGEFIVLFWPKGLADFELESTDTLTPFPVWETVGATPKTIEHKDVVIIPITATQKYYRLRRVVEPEN